MKGLSKSKYTLFCQCPKALWLRTYSCQSWSPPPLLRTRHLGNGESVGTFGAASAELNLFKLCRVVTNEDNVKS